MGVETPNLFSLMQPGAAMSAPPGAPGAPGATSAAPSLFSQALASAMPAVAPALPQLQAQPQLQAAGGAAIPAAAVTAVPAPAAAIIPAVETPAGAAAAPVAATLLSSSPAPTSDTAILLDALPAGAFSQRIAADLRLETAGGKPAQPPASPQQANLEPLVARLLQKPTATQVSEPVLLEPAPHPAAQNLPSISTPPPLKPAHLAATIEDDDAPALEATLEAPETLADAAALLTLPPPPQLAQPAPVALSGQEAAAVELSPVAGGLAAQMGAIDQGDALEPPLETAHAGRQPSPSKPERVEQEAAIDGPEPDVDIDFSKVDFAGAMAALTGKKPASSSAEPLLAAMPPAAPQPASQAVVNQAPIAVAASALPQAVAPETRPAPVPVIHVTDPTRLGEMVGVRAGRSAKDGADTLHIRLDPPELGRIEVRLDLRPDAPLKALVVADNPTTFDLLQRDARGLERALAQAGLATDGSSLSFNLRQQDGREQQSNSGRTPWSGGASGASAQESASADAEPAPAPPKRWGVLGRLNLFA